MPQDLKKHLWRFFLALCAMWLLSLLFVNALPDQADILRDLASDPLQTETDRPAFSLEKGGIEYGITPLFSYSIQGLVVSLHHSDSLFDISHGLWQDNLNIKDICMVWGDNVRDGLYHELSFKSGEFTCFVQSDTYEAWNRFNGEQLSNNHVLAVDPELKSRIMKAAIGDQIRMSGYLVTYSHSGWFSRSSSTTRDDTGDGACETIFVEDFEIIRRGNPIWHVLSAASGWSAFCLGLFLFSWTAKDFFFTRRLTSEQHFDLAEEAILDGNLRTALKELSLALKGSPDMAKAYQLRAAIHEQMGRFQEASQDMEMYKHLQRERDAVPDHVADLL